MITADQYFSSHNTMKYMGSSQFKAFLECEDRALRECKGEYKREKTESLLLGSFLDAHFSKEMDIFQAQNPDIFTKTPPVRLKSNFLHAENAIARIERDSLFMKHLRGEPQVIMTGEIAKVPFKIKMDFMLPDMTVDLKYVKDTKDIWQNGEFVPFWKFYGYDIQAAIYQAVRAQNEGVEKPFRLAVVTKEKGTDLVLFEFSRETLQAALAKVEAYAPRFEQIKQGSIIPSRCECCESCRETKILKDIIII